MNPSTLQVAILIACISLHRREANIPKEFLLALSVEDAGPDGLSTPSKDGENGPDELE